MSRRVTALSEHPQRPDRVRVEVDGHLLGVIALDLAGELGLRVGAMLEPRLEQALERALRRTALLDRALDILAVRARSERDLRRRLARRQPERGDLAWVLERLRRQGYVDDLAYARQVVRQRLGGGAVSRRRVREELYRRGVASDLANQAITEFLEDVNLDEEGAALEVGRKRLKSLAGLEPLVQRRRLYSYLARRGYDAEVIASVLRHLLAAGGRDRGAG
jgi:regulatory protein